MKHLRLRSLRGLWVALAICGPLAAVGSIAVSHAQEGGDRGFRSGSYVVTNIDSSGNFFSRGVITFHADHTMSITDSAQGGPTYYFSSQLGSWQMDNKGRIVARTIDFDYPPNADVARLDFVFNLSRDGTQLTATQAITFFPLEDSDPFGNGGTFFGNFTITGELIRPQ